MVSKISFWGYFFLRMKNPKSTQQQQQNNLLLTIIWLCCETSQFEHLRSIFDPRIFVFKLKYSSYQIF